MRSIRRIKGSSISFVVLFLLMTGYACGQDTAKATFHVSPFDKRSGMSFTRYCSGLDEYKEIFISKNGEAYLYWGTYVVLSNVGTPNGENIKYPDSVNITTNDSIISGIKKIITPQFIDSIRVMTVEIGVGNCFYKVCVLDNGFPTRFAYWAKTTWYYDRPFFKDMNSIIDILDVAFKTYGPYK